MNAPKWRSLREVLEMCMRRFGRCTAEDIAALYKDVPAPDGNQKAVLEELATPAGAVVLAAVQHRFARDRADLELARFGLSADSAHDPAKLDPLARAAHQDHVRTRQRLHEAHARHREHERKRVP